jgi:hypothetical protein
MRFKEGVDMDKEFAHGGDEGALIRFASGEKGLDIGLDDRIVAAGGTSSHEKEASDFGPSALDKTAAARRATIPVVGS